MLNHIALCGRLVKDPELRRTASGTAVTHATIAVDRDFPNADGQREADFIDLLAWNKTAETLASYFRKGRLLEVTGRMQSNSFLARDGTKRKNWEVQIDKLYFVDKAENNPQHAGRPIDVDTPEDFGELTDSDDGLPWDLP